MREKFRRLSEQVARVVGSSWAFAIAALTIMVWAISGPYFHYSDTWQLLINTGTTVVTFLMVFIIQSAQDRDTKVMGLKIDELLRAVEGARTEVVGLDAMTEEELDQIHRQFQTLCASNARLLVSDDLAHVKRALDSRRRSLRHTKPAAPNSPGVDALGAGRPDSSSR